MPEYATNAAPPPHYLHRTLEGTLAQALRQSPALLLTGPRQAGKTTLLQYLGKDTHRYVSLDALDLRAAARADPRAFLDRFPPPVILDEVQQAPELFPFLKEAIDHSRHQPGRFLLSASQNLLLLQEVSETLAGRVSVCQMMPLSRREAAGQPLRPLPWEAEPSPTASLSPQELGAELIRGGYPELVTHPAHDIRMWHASFVQTYLERDLRSLRQVGDLGRFQVFLQILAARCAGLLNFSEVARELGVAVNTVRSWLGILNASYQVFFLRPWYVNLGKRLVKRPKLYFTDTGTLCHLLGLETPGQLADSRHQGAVVENAVVAEVFKAVVHQGRTPRIYFWRTRNGHEVDLLVETPRGMVALEVKATATPKPKHASNLRRLQQVMGERLVACYLVHLGPYRLPLGDGIEALPLAAL